MMDVQISPLLCLSRDALAIICQCLGTGKYSAIVKSHIYALAFLLNILLCAILKNYEI